ncbi:MAG: hypothetical protein ACRDGS_04690 [Chloroflexota bacterium]
MQPGDGQTLQYSLAVPKWQFLCWLCDTHDVLLHGSGNRHIREFEPRQSNDVEAFGNRKAVYAASDGLWPLYFAIVDRARSVHSLINGCFRVIGTDGRASDPYYFFSINDNALPHRPWRAGTIYVLPRGGFEQQSRSSYQGADIEIAQWASLTPVRPLVRIAVDPDDFPFLARIRGHDITVVNQRIARNSGGFPWLVD